MKTEVSFVIPLSGTEDTFELFPPCTCCGKSVEGQENTIYTYHEEYNLKYWVVNRKGYPVLTDKMDGQGNHIKGSVDVHVPYCSEHINPSLSGVHKTLDTGTVVRAIILALALIFGGVIKFTTSFSLVTNSVLTCVGSLIVFFGINMGIRYLITRIPKYQDYPMGSGSWGLAITTSTDGGQKGIGPVRYLSRLDFSNVDSAKRFYEADKRAEVVKGKEYVVS